MLKQAGTGYLSEHDRTKKTLINISVDALVSFLKSALLCWCIGAVENIKDDTAERSRTSTENVGRLSRARN